TRLSGNRATGGSAGFGGHGGAVPLISYNGNGAAGAIGSGGAVYNVRGATVLNCTFSDNTGQGGFSSKGGTQSGGAGINGANGADSQGGGGGKTGTNSLVNCTCTTNTGTGDKGGVVGN